MSDLVGNSEDRFSHNEAHFNDGAGDACIGVKAAWPCFDKNLKLHREYFFLPTEIDFSML